MIAHSSVRRFSTGVPVRAMRRSAVSRRTALAWAVHGFFTCWASSRTSRPHGTVSSSLASRATSEYVVSTTSWAAARRGERRRWAAWTIRSVVDEHAQDRVRSEPARAPSCRVPTTGTPPGSVLSAGRRGRWRSAGRSCRVPCRRPGRRRARAGRGTPATRPRAPGTGAAAPAEPRRRSTRARPWCGGRRRAGRRATRRRRRRQRSFLPVSERVEAEPSPDQLAGGRLTAGAGGPRRAADFVRADLHPHAAHPHERLLGLGCLRAAARSALESRASPSATCQVNETISSNPRPEEVTAPTAFRARDVRARRPSRPRFVHQLGRRIATSASARAAACSVNSSIIAAPSRATRSGTAPSSSPASSGAIRAVRPSAASSSSTTPGPNGDVPAHTSATPTSRLGSIGILGQRLGHPRLIVDRRLVDAHTQASTTDPDDTRANPSFYCGGERLDLGLVERRREPGIIGGERAQPDLRDAPAPGVAAQQLDAGAAQPFPHEAIDLASQFAGDTDMLGHLVAVEQRRQQTPVGGGRHRPPARPRPATLGHREPGHDPPGGDERLGNPHHGRCGGQRRHRRPFWPTEPPDVVTLAMAPCRSAFSAGRRRIRSPMCAQPSRLGRPARRHARARPQWHARHRLQRRADARQSD